MFETLSSRTTPPGRKEVPVQAQSLYSVLTAEDLLSTEERQKSLKQLVEQLKACNIVQQDIESIYLTVLENFAELVQLIPETQDGYFSHPGGILDFGIQTATEALALHRNREILAKTPNLSGQREALWTYAIFSAALLNGLRELVRRLVSLCDSNGRPLEMWLPYEGPMTALKIENATHYRFSFSQSYWPTIYRQGVVPLVMEHILPDHCIPWLASDPWIFNYWLAILCQEASTGTLGNTISFARDQALAKEMALLQQEEERFAKRHKKEENPSDSLSGKSEKENEKFKKKTSEHKLGKLRDPRAGSIRNRKAGMGGVTAGDVFLNWVREGIADGNIKVNHKETGATGVHVVKEGVLLTGSLVQKFAKEDGRFTSNQVGEQLAVRGLIVTESASSKQVSYYDGNPKQNETVAGVLLTDATTVFDNVPKVNPNVTVMKSKLTQAQLPMMHNEQRLLAKMKVPEVRGVARQSGSYVSPLLRG